MSWSAIDVNEIQRIKLSLLHPNFYTLRLSLFAISGIPDVSKLLIASIAVG